MTLSCLDVSPGIFIRFRGSRGSRRCRAGSKEVPGSQGKPRAPERWPESSGRSLDDDFQVEAFFCQFPLFSVLRGRLEEEGEAIPSLDGRVLDTSGFCQVWFPAIRQETGLLDSLGRLDPADKSVPISRLLSIRFLAQNASPRDANSGKMISESSSIGWS